MGACAVEEGEGKGIPTDGGWSEPRARLGRERGNAITGNGCGPYRKMRMPVGPQHQEGTPSKDTGSVRVPRMPTPQEKQHPYIRI